MKGPTSIRKDPACGTCRKKCRKCDRTRPVCKRCVEKGLHCEGYPPKFKFFEFTAPGSGSSPDTGVPDLADRNDENTPLETVPKAVSDSTSSRTLNVNHDEVFTPRFVESPHFPADLESPSADRPPTPVDSILPGNEWLFSHFEEIMVDTLAIRIDGMENPFRQHVTPLAQRHGGVLHALLGLSACHICTSHRVTGRPMMAIALHHRVAALHILGCMLLQEEARGLDAFEEECVLAIVLLLVLHDICEHGVSSHGAHLDGVAFLCGRNAKSTDLSHPSKASTLFFMATLAWLDMLRGFSGAEKLSYSEEVRTCVKNHWSFSLYMTIGCPPDVFHCIGEVLEAAKSHLAGTLPMSDFQGILEQAEAFLRNWDPEKAVFPTNSKDWKLLATAFRHACLLRVMRWPDTFAIPCDDDRIKASVSAILDACSTIPRTSACHKRLLFPLFIAGVDTSSPHQIHYVELAIDHIKTSTGFPHHSMTELLGKVWEERRMNTRGWTNVPWMEFTCSSLLEGQQHAYLFF